MARYIDLEKYDKFETETIYKPICSSVSNNYCEYHECVDCFYDNFNGGEDVKPIIHAKWVLRGKRIFFECSNCKAYASKDGFGEDFLSPFCPVCGAKMDLRISY